MEERMYYRESPLLQLPKTGTWNVTQNMYFSSIAQSKNLSMDSLCKYTEGRKKNKA